jgi:hypothetical protein
LNPFIKEAFSDDHLQGEGLAIAWEDFIAYIHHENFKSYAFIKAI